jgi:N-acetylglutamate synthase-like GNAT family acetyltransferase
MNITYTIEPDLDASEFIDVLNRSGLGVRRPVNDFERMQKMIDCATVVLCARDDGRLVGVARSLTDFSYCCYLSDLAIDKAYQGKKIGRELIVRTQEVIGEEAMLLLLEAPMAKGYYEHVGFEKVENGWILNRKR